VHVRAELDHVVLGSTVDDAAGECFDKTAKLIGLPYPGGPELDRLAQGGNPKAFPFPRPMMNDPGFDFSFSGLKTAVRYFVRDHPELVDEREKVQDLCASVQAAIVEVLVTKTVRAAQKFRLRCITASGGVTANRALRAALAERCKQEGIRLLLTERSFCTDNAAMIGVLAERRMQNGDPTTGLEAEVKPSWELS
jgi:N6-L-threonylcarbamoyladenine synthase